MDAEYSPEVTKKIEEEFHKAKLHRPMRIKRYDVGTELIYEITEVAKPNKARVRLLVESFAGGGFAGQVYKVRVLEIGSERRQNGELEVGGIYAMKILIPPTDFSRLFRNTLYWIGFQALFQPQINPAAARAGALWQKFIRRGARIRFGDERVVSDIHATFVDSRLGSCGELSEWVEGRTWKLESDDHLDLLKQWKRGKRVDPKNLGSPEYRAKREFMANFVDLLHSMGAFELARQYEWTTCKSQPNCLKRAETEGSPSEGLTAIDFRAGLALLPFLPMSPGDFKMIAKGIIRGSLIQFDRGDVRKLEQFVMERKEQFADMLYMLEELKKAEHTYRNSIPDITHNHVRLLYHSRLWSTMLDSAVTGWKIKNLIDDQAEKKLRYRKALTLMFFIIGLIPFFGRVLRKTWGGSEWRKHYKKILTSRKYLVRAIHGKIAEKTIAWHRSGRVAGERALNLARKPLSFFCHLPLSILPAKLHRFITDCEYAKEHLAYLTVRPFRLYFDAKLREQWLEEMVLGGKKKHLLNDEEAATILSQTKDPFIQKYLKSLAVHVCTLPVTQIVSAVVALVYVFMHPEMPRAQAWAIGIGIIALFQLTPISPGSLVRGFYVLYLVIRERNFKDYNIAVFLGFFKYIGYLAFPIQMTYHYPELARFMAGHWATEAVHAVPVFGERGALLEHGVFCLLYNRPLTIRRRMRIRSEVRATMKPRYWHIILCAIGGTFVFGLADVLYIRNLGSLPPLREIWFLVVLVPVICGAAVTLGAGGASLAKRVIEGILCGATVGGLSTGIAVALVHEHSLTLREISIDCVWKVFIFAVLSTISVLLTELNLPEPKTS